VLQPDERLAVYAAGPELEAYLRRTYPPQSGRAYVGFDYRVYPHMRVDQALRFYSELNARWDHARVHALMAQAEIYGNYEIGRMRSVYQRALVLVAQVGALPTELIVERGEDFENGLGSLLETAISLVPSAIVTYGTPGPPELASFTRVTTEADFMRASLAEAVA
jgi:hypothetical protein